MDPRAIATLGVVALVALAGCIGSGTDPSATGSGGNDTASPADDGADVDNGRTAETSSVPLGNVTVDWDGSTGLDACVPTGLNTCSGAGTPGDSSRVLDAPQPESSDANRTLTGSLDLTWTAQDPTTEEMGISLSWTESCGDTCTVFHPVAGAFGTSPVELRLDGIEVPGNRTLEISVSAWFDPTPSPLVAELHTDQAFHVEGSITVDAVPAGD